MFNSTMGLMQFEFILQNGVPALLREGSVTVVGRETVGVSNRGRGDIYVYAHTREHALKLLKEYLIDKRTKSWKLTAIYDLALDYIYFLPPVLIWNSDIQRALDEWESSTNPKKADIRFYKEQVEESVDSNGNPIKSLVAYTPLQYERELEALKEEMIRDLTLTPIISESTF